MSEPADSFTISDYRAILDAARDRGYAFARFSDPEPDPSAAVLYLRHDIDNCIESALLMAEVEARAGAVSTYLVMVRSANYNPFTGANVKRLLRIRDLGHEVGLHFSAAEHEPLDLERDLGSCIRTDARLLEHALGEPVRVFSFHNPTESDRPDIVMPGMVNVYAARFFRDAHYMSESNMRWPHGSPRERLDAREHPVVQILVHPLSYRDDFKSDRDVLLWFLADTVTRLLALNVDQNRVLRREGVSLADVAGFLAQQ